MKIVYDPNKQTIRNTDYGTECGLQELKFYVPKSFSKSLFLMLENKQQQNDFEIIKLHKKSYDQTNKYSIYAVGFDKKIKSRQSLYGISLLYFDQHGQLPVFSSSIDLILSFNKFKYTSNIYFISEASKEISEKYEKIVKLSELNLEILNRMSGEDK